MTIRGRITDASNGQTLPGATVAVRTMGTDALIGGTITDASGYFTTIVNDGQYVVLSFIGYRTLVPILRASTSATDVATYAMERDTVNVPEVVVTALAKKDMRPLILAVVAAALLAWWLMRE
jgi:hypothetical protein